MQKLTHEERVKSHGLERRIQAAGVPIVEARKDEKPELLIRQNFEAYDSVMFEFSGGTGIVLPVKIVPNIPIFVLSAVDIHVDRLPNSWFRLLEESAGGGWPHYYFYGEVGMKFDRDETINRFITQQVKVHRGNPIQGLLLASWLDTIPADIVRSEILEGSITIFDQFEHEHHAKIRLRVDGEPGQRSSRQLPILKTRRRLLDQPDTQTK